MPSIRRRRYINPENPYGPREDPDWAQAAASGIEGFTGGFVQGQRLAALRTETRLRVDEAARKAREAEAEQARRQGIRESLSGYIGGMQPQPRGDGLTIYERQRAQQEQAATQQSIQRLQGLVQNLEMDGTDDIRLVLDEARRLLGTEALSKSQARLETEIGLLAKPDPEGGDPAIPPEIAEQWTEILHGPEGVIAAPRIKAQIRQIKNDRAIAFQRTRGMFDGLAKAAELRQTLQPKEGNRELFDELESHYRDGLYVDMSPEELDRYLRSMATMPPEYARHVLDTILGESSLGLGAFVGEERGASGVGSGVGSGDAPPNRAAQILQAKQASGKPIREVFTELGIDPESLTDEEETELLGALGG